MRMISCFIPSVSILLNGCHQKLSKNGEDGIDLTEPEDDGWVDMDDAQQRDHHEEEGAANTYDFD
jgi:hypothetical protein